MEPWTELAKMGPVVGLLGFAVVSLWRKLQEKDSTIATMVEQQRQDQKEHAKQLLASSKAMEVAIRELYRQKGRSLSPYPSSSP